PLHVPARVSAVVVPLREADPALALLAGDVRLGAQALGVERVEVLLEPFLAALARVDRAADRRLGGAGGGALGHATASSAFLPPPMPKKRCPFQCPPVTSLAMAVSDRYTRPSCSKPFSSTLTTT